MSQPVSSPDAPPTASLGALPAQLGALLALCAALAGAALASQHLGSPLLATAAMLAQLCLLTGTLLLLPLLLDRTVRKPLATLARGMMSLTPPHADDIIRLSGRADAVGEVARASILLLERHDHVEGIASSVRDAQGVARDLRKMADRLMRRSATFHPPPVPSPPRSAPLVRRAMTSPAHWLTSATVAPRLSRPSTRSPSPRCALKTCCAAWISAYERLTGRWVQPHRRSTQPL
jgi:hypothetical protein